MEPDALKRGAVQVKIDAAGLRHSDLVVINGDCPRPMPVVRGHKSAGESVECGAGVGDLKPRDRAVTVFMPSCGVGNCVPGMEGRPGLRGPDAASKTTGTLLSGKCRLSLNGKTVNYHVGVSCVAEHAVISHRSCVKLESATAELPSADAALFGCALLTGAGDVINSVRMRAGTSVAVLGLGGVGSSAPLAAMAGGAREVIALDLNDESLEIARTLEPTGVVRVDSLDAVESVRQMTCGGVDYALEMAGAIPAFELAWIIARRRGLTVSVASSRVPLCRARCVARRRATHNQGRLHRLRGFDEGHPTVRRHVQGRRLLDDRVGNKGRA